MTKSKIFLVPFPYDDLSSDKLRPVVCLTEPIGTRRHVIVAYITSQIPVHLFDTDILADNKHPDFKGTGLKQTSVIRVHYLLTISTVVIKREIGKLPSDIQSQIAEKLCNLFKSDKNETET